MLARLGLFIIRILGLLPLRRLAPADGILGMLLYRAAWERRRVVGVNLKLRFPRLADRDREKLFRLHFRASTENQPSPDGWRSPPQPWY